jgi:hypothetical protein
MNYKPKLSIPKQLKIKTMDLIFGPEQGKYFPIKSTNVAKYIPALRQSVPLEYYGHLIKEVKALHATDQMFLTGKRKRTLADLCSDIPFHLNLDSEFAWAKNILETSILELNNFVTLSEKYSDYLLSGNYQEASQKLDEIEETFGFSIWLIKNRIALLQLSEGLESQKRFTQEIKNGLKNGSMPKYLVYWISIRNEEQTSVSRFTTQINSTLAKLNPSRQAGFDFYIKYHLLGLEPLNPEEFSHIVRISYSTSIIDLYEAFIALLRVLSIHSDQKSVAKAFFYLFKEKVVQDGRIDILKMLFQIDKPALQSSTPETIAYDLLLKGDLKGAEACVLQQITVNPSNPALIVAHAHIEAQIGASGFETKAIAEDSGEFDNIVLRSLLVKKLAKIISDGTVLASKEFNELNKLSLNFNGFPWVSTILQVFSEENFLTSAHEDSITLLPLKAAIFHPLFLGYLSSPMLTEEYKKICEFSFSESLVLRYHLALHDTTADRKNLGLSSIYSSYLEAIRNYHERAFIESIDYCGGLIKSNLGFFRRRGYGLLSRCYLQIDNLIAACETMSSCYVNHKEFYPFLPLQEFGKKIKPGSVEWRKVNHMIDLSIVCDAYVKQISHDLETARRFAYEDFLLKLGIDKPSDLKPYINTIDQRKVLYYLNHICIESNMDTSSAFNGGSQEVVEERLAICRMLTEIDPNNTTTYKEEIKELVRRLVINSRRQEVDQSRIYVDIQSVKEKAEIELKENFERYKAYIKYDLKSVVGIDKGPANQELQKTKGGDLGINTPENEIWELLDFLLNEVKKLYLSVNIGLDRFISTRIRHGELERNMRSPIQKHNLITKRKVKNGPYLRNEFWINKIVGSTESVQKVNTAFVRFSEAYDQLISRIANEWLQIKKVDKPNGLFDFEILGTDLELIAHTVNENTTLTEFVDILIQHLDSKLIVSLLNIREQLYNDGKSQGKALLNKLLDDVNKVLPQGIPDLNAAVSQARIEFGAQFDKIIEWFVPSYSGNSSPYSIEDAVMVAEAIVKEGHPSFKVNVEADEESTFLIHGRLPIFMDVFINIFENVVKRSGLETPEADVRIWASEYEETVRIIHCSIINELGIQIDSKQVAADLKRKKSLLEAETYHDYLALEGDSGLFKIYKSVKDFYLKDAPLEPTVDFGVKDGLYTITLSVPFKIYTLQQDEELG